METENRWVTFLKKFVNSVERIIIVVLVGVIIFLLLFQGCGRGKDCPECPEIIAGKTVTIHDTVPVEKLLPKPYPVYRDTGSTKIKTIVSKFDSIQLARYTELFFSTYFYNDTLQNDTSALAILMYSITQNEMQKRKWVLQNRTKTTVTNNTIVPVNPEKFRFYVGGGLMVKPFSGDVISADVNLGVLGTYKRVGIQLSYGMFGKSIDANFYYKLQIKPKKK